MNNYNIRVEHKSINTANIIVDRSYQRDLRTGNVRSIVSNFNPATVNPPKLSYRDGKFYVFDGQHTIAALKTMNGGADLAIECRVYYGMTREEEAVAFVNQTGVSSDVETIYKLKALYNDGVNPDKNVALFHSLTCSVGFRMDFTKAGADNKLIAVAKAYKIFNSVSADDYVGIMSIVKKAWDGAQKSMSGEILGGVYLFHRTFKGRYNTARLIQKLSDIQPNVIIRDGKAVYGGGDIRFAKQIWNIYNKNASAHRLPDEL
jgi:hypothetical protein